MTEPPADTEPSSKPWKWPGEWVRDEKFWRDVASRVAAALIVVGLGYTFAIASGYLAAPKPVITALFIIGGVGLGFTILVGLVAAARMDNSKVRTKEEGRFAKTVWVIGGCSMIVLAMANMLSIAAAIFHW
jgi:hypothetical protein